MFSIFHKNKPSVKGVLTGLMFCACALAFSLRAQAAPPNFNAIPVVPIGSTPILVGPPASAIIALASGGQHCLALDSDGTVWAWGDNTNGQLGNGSVPTFGYYDTPLPARVHNLLGITRIACGYAHSLALQSNGTVWCWGANDEEQVGNGVSTDTYVVPYPVPVSGLSGVVAIAGGGEHSMALKSDGTVWCWGGNDYGELGDGTTNYSSSPVEVKGSGGSGFLTNVVAIAAGMGEHSMALRKDGTVWGWGDNSLGELGNGTTTDSATPVQASGLSGIVAIAGGYGHSVALKSDGTVWCWGYDAFGQLGNGTFNSTSLTPAQVSGLSGIVAIGAGEEHTVALKSDGTVWCWGVNYDGELGNGTFTTTGNEGIATPVQVVGLTSEGDLNGITTIAGGGFQNLALASNGSVFTWGANQAGQLGDGGAQHYDPDSSAAPVPALGLFGTVAIAGGSYQSLALNFDGTVQAWGRNDLGQLGDGTFQSSELPVQLPKVTGIVAIATGGYHSMALKTNGTILTWGDSTYGQLGSGTDTGSDTPVQVKGSGGFGYLSSVVAVSAGYWHSLALKSDGTVWAWGDNEFGQLGSGTTNGSDLPTQVKGAGGNGYLTGVIAIAAGFWHSLALRNDGTVWAWGYNNNGQLGNGAFTSAAPYGITTPAQVPGLNNVAAISAGQHSLAMTNDGSVWAWGDNYFGEVGNGTYSTTGNEGIASPTQVIGTNGSGSLNGIVAIASGSYHSLAVDYTGTVYAWGDNNLGALGAGAFTAGSAMPVTVTDLGNITTLAAGLHSLALDVDGFVWGWGYNGDGQLGNNTLNNSDLPSLVLELK